MASSSLTEAGPQDSTADSGDGEDSQLLEKHSYHLYSASSGEVLSAGMCEHMGVHIIF